MPRIYDELIRAQLENLASDPSAGLTARIWNNTTSGQVKVDDGTNIRALLRNDQKMIMGNSGTASENVRWNRAGLTILELVPGDDVTAENSNATFVAQLGARQVNYTDGGKPSNGNAGRLIFNSTYNSIDLDNGSKWLTDARWEKFVVSHTALQNASNSHNVELFSLPSKTFIHKVVVKHTVAFAGTGITAYTISVGIGSDLIKYAMASDVFQAAGDSVFNGYSSFGGESFSSSTSIRVAAESVGGLLNASTAGSVDIWVLKSTLP